MILRVILLSLLAGPALIQALNIPVVCPCTFVANRAIKVVKHVLSDNDNCDCSLPPRQCRESYDNYIQRVFSQRENEPVENYYTRIYKQYKDESNEKYIERVREIYRVFPKLPCKDNTEYWKFSEKFYTLNYGRIGSIIPLLNESKDQYYARILRREKDEDFDSYIKRLDCVYKAYPKLDIWRRIKFDSDCRNWYFYRHSAYNCAIRPSENIRESVATKYSRRECEKGDDFSYFKRIAARLPGESNEDYVDRITRIQSRFGELPLWYKPEYLDLTKDYYKLLYARKDKEDCKDYYKRLTMKSTTEDFPTYVKRLTILQKLFSDLPLWYNCDYLQYTAPFYKWIFAKKSNEDNVSYLKRITARNPSETSQTYLNRLNICRWINRGTDLFTNREYWPYIKCYYENFVKKGKEGLEPWLGRIFKRDYDESDDQYCNRLSQVMSVLDKIGKIDIPEACLKYVSDFYRLWYRRHADEDQKIWLDRITKRLPIETDTTYATRLRYLENVYTDCRSLVGGVLKRLFGSGKSCCSKDDKEVEVLLVKKKEKEEKYKESQSEKQSTEKKVCDKKPDKKSIEEQIEELLGRKKGENEDSWFKRLTKRSPDESIEQYIKNCNIARKYFPSIPLWYNKKNFDCVKEYYTYLYKRLENETDEEYFKRITSKEPWESWDQAAGRVAIVRALYPCLSLWRDEKWYDKFTKNIYEAECKKKPGESIEQYVQRLLAKDSVVDVSPDDWAKRVRLEQLATASSPVWCDEKYYSFTKSFYEIWYKKGEQETCDAWLSRVLKPLPGESEDNAIKRVSLVKRTTGDCGCWTEFTFKKVASSKCLSQEYLEDIEDKFFDSATTYERVYSSSKSSARSEASSSSEEQVKVVQKA